MQGKLLIALVIVAEVVGSSFLKSTEHFTKPIPSIIVIVCYAVAYYSFSWALDSVPLGVVYSIWCSAGIVVLTVVGMVFYKEMPDIWAVIGITLIVAGVLIVNLFSKMGE